MLLSKFRSCSFPFLVQEVAIIQEVNHLDRPGFGREYFDTLPHSSGCMHTTNLLFSVKEKQKNNKQTGNECELDAPLLVFS